MAQTLLVLIPCPGIGRLFSAVELANLLVGRDPSLSITVLVMKLPIDNPKGESPPAALDASADHGLHPQVCFVYLPDDGTLHDMAANNFYIRLVESYGPHVYQAVAKLASDCNSSSLQRRLGGFVLDMFCASMVDVADSFGVPSYIYFTSSSAMLGVMLHLQKLRDDYSKDVAGYRNLGEELGFPGFACPLPAEQLPSLVLRPETVGLFLDNYRRFRETRGIIVNTFLELEPHPLKFLQSEPGLPKVYPVGPIVNMWGSSVDSAMGQDGHEVVEWLDRQREASVVFLCFGSMGGRFDEDQVSARNYPIGVLHKLLLSPNYDHPNRLPPG
ncbi:hypothetical protein MLD38_024370 [Melastoma candidum]|uniref:Uncharacterized protein n=1 Tax=Melastoma candidum TaxID=119954 RepID=A0ACB9NTE2_9MYRT|nr:hypothetical protein MLD38_024370 [Melastoma candidum]